MVTFAAWTAAIVVGLVLVVAVLAAEAWLLMWAWNTLVPSLFGFAELSYLQAVAVVVFIMFIGWIFRSRN